MHELEATITLILFQQDQVVYWKMCPSVHLSTCCFNTAASTHYSREVLQYSERRIRRGLELPFPGLHAHLTSVFTIIFALEHLKLKFCASTVDTGEQQFRRVQKLKVK